jgi:hypothetical protein
VQNYYAAEISIFVQSPEEKDWQQVILNHTLMPSPFTEDYGQDHFVICSSTSLSNGYSVIPAEFPRIRIIRIRMVLAQPATCWQQYGIRQIGCYSEEPAVKAAVTTSPSSSDRMQQLSELLATVIACKQVNST